MLVRVAHPEDVDRLLDIHVSAFPDPRGLEARSRNFLEHPLGDLSELRVVEEGGRLLAHAFLFRAEAWFGGRPVRAGAIASVGVAPEARGRGVGTHLLEALHAEAGARGDAVTILFPFRQGFYAKLGYAPVTSTRRLHVSPRAIPSNWRGDVRSADARDRPAIERAYLRAAKRATGWITRTPRMWDRVLYLDDRRQWFVLPRGDEIAGFVAWTAEQAEAHAATTLVVHDLVADDDDARRALLGLLGAQRDQVQEVLLEIDADDPLDRALVDADGARHGTADLEHPLGRIVGGPMVRIVDTARALEARGWAKEGGLLLDVDGARLALEVGAASAKVAVEAAGERAGRAADLHLSRAALAAVAFGALAPSAAARLGWLRARDASTLARADAIFALPPYFAIDTF
jgi:predicted acetyltransferase